MHFRAIFGAKQYKSMIFSKAMKFCGYLKMSVYFGTRNFLSKAVQKLLMCSSSFSGDCKKTIPAEKAIHPHQKTICDLIIKMIKFWVLPLPTSKDLLMNCPSDMISEFWHEAWLIEISSRPKSYLCQIMWQSLELPWRSICLQASIFLSSGTHRTCCSMK